MIAENETAEATPPTSDAGTPQQQVEAVVNFLRFLDLRNLSIGFHPSDQAGMEAAYLVPRDAGSVLADYFGGGMWSSIEQQRADYYRSCAGDNPTPWSRIDEDMAF